jgi:hypothetical protein
MPVCRNAELALGQQHMSAPRAPQRALWLRRRRASPAARPSLMLRPWPIQRACCCQPQVQHPPPPPPQEQQQRRWHRRLRRLGLCRGCGSRAQGTAVARCSARPARVSAAGLPPLRLRQPEGPAISASATAPLAAPGQELALFLALPRCPPRRRCCCRLWPGPVRGARRVGAPGPASTPAARLASFPWHRNLLLCGLAGRGQPSRLHHPCSAAWPQLPGRCVYLHSGTPRRAAAFAASTQLHASLLRLLS